MTISQVCRRMSALTGAVLLASLLITGCVDHRVPFPGSAPGIITLVSGLKAPLGIDTDYDGRVWVSEAGTGNNDGQVSVITADGKINPIITGFPSQIFQGEVSGVGHLLFSDGMLFITHDNGKLYKANVSAANIGNPISASTVATEDVGAFVKDQTNQGVITGNPDKESHPYHIAAGPDGRLLITDAAANAIIVRQKATGTLTVLANIPGKANPTPVGPPFIQSVPTGVIYDAQFQRVLVSTLNGFPFPMGQASVYQISQGGLVTLLQSGFNSMTGIDINPTPVLLEYGTFGQMGWEPKTGRLVRINNPGPATTVLASGLNLPTALKKIDGNNYYVISLGDNALLKVTF